jgi:dTDP-4-dehydrorhamnose reductase
MKLLVTGGRGQLGRAFARRGAARGHDVVAMDVDELDICDAAQVAARLDAIAPAAVVNAAAYTAVDRAESERERAHAINAVGAEHVARACAARGIALLHVSTDYVFDGTATRPYREDDPIAPTSTYGATKADGEAAVRAAGGTIVRTSWLFEQDGPSFVHTMLRLARERAVLRVVNDQRGCPTWADDLADALLDLAAHRDREPIYHFCNAGETTWHGFAVAIVDEARALGPIACERVEPITTADYPTPARRPPYSVLDTARIGKLGIVPRTWLVGMRAVVRHVIG